jgi:hypothetical protein
MFRPPKSNSAVARRVSRSRERRPASSILRWLSGRRSPGDAAVWSNYKVESLRCSQIRNRNWTKLSSHNRATGFVSFDSQRMLCVRFGIAFTILEFDGAHYSPISTALRQSFASDITSQNAISQIGRVHSSAVWCHYRLLSLRPSSVGR